jgi:hypothetical protein
LVQYYYRKKAEKHAMFGEAFSYLALSIAEPKATRVINLTAEFDATWPVDGFAKKMTFPGSNLNMLGE